MSEATQETAAGEVLSAEQMLAYDIFSAIDKAEVARFVGGVKRRSLMPGDLVFREKDPGNTAFYIVEGAVRIFVSDAHSGGIAKKQNHGTFAWFFNRMLGNRKDATRLLPLDAAVDVHVGHTASTMGAGEVLGEMSALSGMARSATVVSLTRSVVLEIGAEAYEVLQFTRVLKQRMDETYRARSLSNHLRNVPILSGLSEPDIERLRRNAELVTLPGGEVIFKQGDAADDAKSGGMYIVRLGEVLVTLETLAGTRPLATLGKSDCFGETGLLFNARRNATCTAVDYSTGGTRQKTRPARVELVKIKPEDFNHIIGSYPAVRAALEQLAARRMAEQKTPRRNEAGAGTGGTNN
jgi:CRP-like cAMP-binding protein